MLFLALVEGKGSVVEQNKVRRREVRGNGRIHTIAKVSHAPHSDLVSTMYVYVFYALVSESM